MSQSFRYCPNCGTQNPKEAEECIKCGLVFSKFKPFSITVEKVEQKKSNFFYYLIFFVGLLFLSYMITIVIIEKKFLNVEEKKGGIYNLTMKLENIYKKLPIENIEQKTKCLKEIELMEKMISTIPVSEDIEKLNIFSENLKDIKNILLKNKELDLNTQKKLKKNLLNLNNFCFY